MTIWDSVARTLRPLADASLPDFANIEEMDRVRRPGGAIDATPQTVTENVPCRVVPVLPSTETNVAGQPQATNRFNVFLPLGTPIAEGMRITARGTDLDGVDWSRAMRVVAVDGPKTYEVLRGVVCVALMAGEK